MSFILTACRCDDSAEEDDDTASVGRKSVPANSGGKTGESRGGQTQRKSPEVHTDCSREYGDSINGQRLSQLPWQFIEIRWSFAELLPEFERFDIDVTVTNVSPEFNVYISPFKFYLNDNDLYGGIQTHSGGWRSKTDHTSIDFRGAVFSRWSKDKKSPLSLDYVHMYDDGACYSSGIDGTPSVEGSYCGVRRPYAWTSGVYTFSLVKESVVSYLNAPHSWVSYEITDKNTKETKRIGSLLFDGDRLKMLASTKAFVEVYGEERKVPYVAVSFGYPKIIGIEPPASRVVAQRFHVTPNITTVSSHDKTITVVVDPCNPRSGTVSHDAEEFDMK